MDFKRIDFQSRRGKKFKIKNLWIFVCIGLIFLITAIFLISKSSTSSSVSVFNFGSIFHKDPFGAVDGKVNILLLGNAGGSHAGPSLTDSIIVASYDLDSSKATLISIPRDFWLNNIGAKINAVYEIGEKDGMGLNFAEGKIGEVLGIPIQYGVRANFSGFAKAIDTVGGIEVEVAKTFDDVNFPIEGKEDELCDYKEEDRDLSDDDLKKLNLPGIYPPDLWYSSLPNPPPAGRYKILLDPTGAIATDSNKIRFDCRFEHIHYDEGATQMDGETALKFVRSRMGTNSEGSDFARSKRQQLVLQAFREKVLSLETLTNPAKIAVLISTFGDSIETDIPNERFLDFYNLIKNTKKVNSVVLGNLGNGKSILVSPPPGDFGGAYVLIPKNNDPGEIKKFIKNTLNKEPTQ